MVARRVAGVCVEAWGGAIYEGHESEECEKKQNIVRDIAAGFLGHRAERELEGELMEYEVPKIGDKNGGRSNRH